MKNYSAKIKNAIKKLDAICSFSGILDARDYGSCVELVVNRWGDTCTFRVYNNGEITER